MALLDVKGLVKAFPSVTGGALEVLRGVSFRVTSGETVAIVGESGTGKSTLLHLLGALDRPTSGTVHFKGQSLYEADDEALAAFRNRSIGFVFQFHHLLPEFTALENVAMPALIQHQRLEEVRPRAMDLLKTVGLADRAEHRPHALSGGEKQRVAIARALINAPDLVLADEPTGNLDTNTAEVLHEEILRLSRENRQTFILVTHNLHFAAMADRVLRLAQGKLREVDRAEVASW